MKINWGTGIVLAFIGFIGFILFFVVRMTMDHSADHDLVTSDYYSQELNYQKKIDAGDNTAKLTEKIEIIKTNNGIEITFPSTMFPNEINGEIAMYRPSNKRLDFATPIILTKQTHIISDTMLVSGRWDITVTWTHKSKEYQYRKKITY